MKLNARETAKIATHLTDLQTYVESTVLLWMTGQTELQRQQLAGKSVDCKMRQSMKLDEILEVYTGAYERLYRSVIDSRGSESSGDFPSGAESSAGDGNLNGESKNQSKQVSELHENVQYAFCLLLFQCGSDFTAAWANSGIPQGFAADGFWQSCGGDASR